MELHKGLESTKEIIVQEKDSAKSLGSGGLNVFGTPAMIALMENVALDMVRQYIPIDSDTVGIEINAKHIKASKIGSKITCTAKITDIDGRKISYDIKAFDESGDIIGTASHQRFIVNVDKFMSKL